MEISCLARHAHHPRAVSLVALVYLLAQLVSPEGSGLSVGPPVSVAGATLLSWSGSIYVRYCRSSSFRSRAAGYLKITDLGIARVWNPENSKDTSGTPGYMAPEVMCKQPHGVAVDYFAMGIIGYECMFGRRPYVGKNRREIRDHILSKQILIKR